MFGVGRRSDMIRQRVRVTYAPSGDGEMPPLQPLPASFEVQIIDANLLRRTDLVNLDWLTDEIDDEWSSVDAFLNNGSGACVLEGAKIVSWCTMEYISRSACSVGVATLQEYSGRGLGTAAAHHCAKECARQGRTIFWDAWQSNHASVGIARHLGFEKKDEYPVYFGET